ncbi:MAG: 50S ribosomal protein L11 methyltransferase [Hyphomicrobiaceae bacterium]
MSIGAGDAGGLVKLVVRLSSDGAARQTEAALGALADPMPLAVTRFEDGPAAWLVEAYFADELDEATLAALLAGLEGVTGHSLEAVPEENWVAHVEAELAPVRAGRFVVHGPHDRARVGGEPFAIEIEAGEAFGTAHHPTTEGCLVAIDRLLAGWSPRTVLDLGTGSGVLAIAVAKVLAHEGAAAQPILASDIDPRSVEIAAENAGKNGVGGRIEALVADGLDHPRIGAAGRLDLILANILAEPLIGLAPKLTAALEAEGRMVLSGLLATQAPAVRAAYEAAGLGVLSEVPIGDWTTLVLGRA